MHSQCPNNTQWNSFTNCTLYVSWSLNVWSSFRLAIVRCTNFATNIFSAQKQIDGHLREGDTLKSIAFVRIMAYLISINLQRWNELLRHYDNDFIYLHKRKQEIWSLKKETCCVRLKTMSFFNQSQSIDRVHCSRHWQFFNWNCWIIIELVSFYLSNEYKSKSTIYQFWMNIFSISN